MTFESAKTSAPGPSDDLYQITDASGTMHYQSPAMRDLDVPLDINWLRRHYRHHRDEGDFTTYDHRQGDVRVLASKVQVGSKEYRIQVATTVSVLYDVLQTFGVWAWTGLPLILCAAGFGGYWLSGRAMKPVYNLVLSTREITERDLSKRIQVPDIIFSRAFFPVLVRCPCREQPGCHYSPCGSPCAKVLVAIPVKCEAQIMVQRLDGSAATTTSPDTKRGQFEIA